MRRTTHLAVGALCVLPLAIDLPWQPAGGVVFLGLAGAVIPDYFDLRSDARGLLRHRGVSHSLVVGALATALVYLIVRSLSRIDDQAIAFDSEWIVPLTAAFATGLLSHLALDACTPRGIKPVLPVSGLRFWLLPRSLRITTGGQLDRLMGFLASVVFLAVVATMLIGR